jgi:O-antigen ligase
VKRLENTLFFLIILFLPTQLGKHLWPSFSYIYSLKIDYFSPTIYFWDLLVLGLFIIWIIQKPKINLLALNLFSLFLLTQITSLFWAQNPMAGVVRMEQYILSFFLGIYIASNRFEDIIKKVRLPLIAGLSVESVLSFAQIIKGGSLGFWVLGERSFNLTTLAISKFNFYSLELLRPYGTFSHPNVLASYLLLGLLLIFRKVNPVTIIVITAVILTFSRVATLVLLFCVPLLLKAKKHVVLLFLLLALSPLILIRFVSVLEFDSLSFLRRTELISASFEIFSKSPLVGVGLNNFISTLSSDIIAGPARFLQPVHNIFLLVLSETGILGVMGMFGMLGYPIYRVIKLQISNSKFQILLIWCVIIFLGMFDHYFLTLPQGYRMLFMLWGLTISVIESKDAKS